ncbi:valine--tRNA ligase [Patescibacteria group bacterium]
MKELSKVYDSKKVENRIYALWEKSGFFNPDKLPKRHKKPYCIVIPPPNITGELHMGHALNATVQDILIRKKRMQGYKTLWLPGTDHAGIATQNKVEKELKKQGKTRFDLGREKFTEIAWQWREKYGNIILDQLKKLGSSCDWSRTKFTLDKKYCLAVEKAFNHYYKKGLIYKGKRVVNWCPRCQTSLSDLELEYEEKKGKLWYLKYPFSEKKSLKDYMVMATTRPETMLGDTAVAVNPKDKRYKNLVGKKVILPLVGREIPIIADRLVDPKFGTGALKVTPAHDLTDYEIGLKHKLKSIQVIDETGKITKQAPLNYQGLRTFEAREKIIEDLKNKGFLKKTEDYILSVPKCYRCQTTIELIPSEQWFLKMDKLAKLAFQAVKSGKVKFISKKWEKIYFNWLKNIRDWCLSRQIWWGHKIPLKGETDVLDTWFSSALWPFAVLGWPEDTKDLKEFYPTNVLSTGRDLISFWVTRMIFSGMEFTKKAPFNKVYFHPLVLTKEGKKMSKSLGTGIDPINLIERYGADATRFGIAYQIMKGQDIRFVEDNIIMGKKFCNKIWNASRFSLFQISDSKFQIPEKSQVKKLKLTKADRTIIKGLDKTIKSINKNLDDFQFGKAAHIIYDFFWHDFCDKYVEISKKQIINSKTEKEKTKTRKVLFCVLLNSLKLLHPFVPFITEEIYQKLPKKQKKQYLMIETWPN